MTPGKWRLSEDEKIITGTFKLDKDLTDMFFEIGGARELGMGSDGIITVISEIISIDEENLCLDTYLQGIPDDKEKECYKKITDEQYSEITNNYVDMNEFFRVFISISQEMGYE